MSANLLTWEEAVQWLRDQPDKQDLVRHCYFDDPIEQSLDRFSTSEEWFAVKQLLKPALPGIVLDIGAGRGISSYAFAKAGCQVTALEPNPSPLVGAQAIQNLVERTSLPINVVQTYGETLPFADNSFDIVYGRAVLHHAQNLKNLCQEAARVLKSNGIFIATREHVLSQPEDLQTFLDNHALHFLYGGEHAYLLQDYLQAIQTAGLTLKRTIAPFESVINYAPMTHAEFQTLLTETLKRRIGSSLASWVSGNKLLQQRYGRYLSQKSTTPGRHYSFVAVKP